MFLSQSFSALSSTHRLSQPSVHSVTQSSAGRQSNRRRRPIARRVSQRVSACRCQVSSNNACNNIEVRSVVQSARPDFDGKETSALTIRGTPFFIRIHTTIMVKLISIQEISCGYVANRTRLL